LPSYVSLSQNRWERYGIILRDDGFGGMSHSFEGGGNCYALLYDNDDGRLRAGRLVDAVVSDFLSSAQSVTTSGWRRLRIEARGNSIKYLLDGTLLTEVTDTTFPSGQCGFGYYWNPGSPATYPAARGAYFDNFVADTLETNTTPVIATQSAKVLSNGLFQFTFSGASGNIYEVQCSTNFQTWEVVKSVLLTGGIAEVTAPATNVSRSFYRVRFVQ
jgi:hypothetical protein